MQVHIQFNQMLEGDSMTHKIVLDADGELVCFGPNNENYEPNIPNGCSLHIVDTIPGKGKKELIKDKIQAIKDEYLKRLYVGIPATFPGAVDATIQLRNDNDMNAILSVISQANAYINIGNPTANMVFRTDDNVNRDMVATEIISIIANAFYSHRDSLLLTCWAHKDLVRQLSLTMTAQEIIDYDISSGW